MMTQFPRMVHKSGALKLAGMVLVMMLVMPLTMTQFAWDKFSGGSFVFVVAVMAVWYLGALWLLGMGLTALHTIRIEDGCILVCMGPLTLRRIPCEQIRTVGLGYMPARMRERAEPAKMLVLSVEGLDQLEARGAKQRPEAQTYTMLARLGISRESSHFPARLAIATRVSRAKLYVERTTESESALRRCLPGAKFLL